VLAAATVAAELLLSLDEATSSVQVVSLVLALVTVTGSVALHPAVTAQVKFN